MESTKQYSIIRRVVGLKGIEVYGHIGYFPEERKMGRLFRLDIDAEYVAPEVGATPPIDYREIAHMIKERFVSEGVLIEHLAEEIAVAIFNRWNTVEKVRIAVHKVHPPVGILAESAYAYVEMERP